MIIAKQKRRENIAEYILYLWQIEDILRACNLDFDIVKKQIIEGYNTDELTTKEITGWYESLIHMMHSENIEKKGHLQFVKNSINELNEIHLKLLSTSGHSDYMRYFTQAKANIDFFRKKSNNLESNDVEICLNALYTLLLMNISGKQILPETAESMETFSKLIALLAHRFKEWEDGSLEL
jgi:hypothetical protein